MGKLKTVSKPMNIHLKMCFPVSPCNWDLRVVSLGASDTSFWHITAYRLIYYSHATHRHSRKERGLSQTHALLSGDLNQQIYPGCHLFPSSTEHG